MKTHHKQIADSLTSVSEVKNRGKSLTSKERRDRSSVEAHNYRYNKNNHRQGLAV